MVQELCPYVFSILPRPFPKALVLGEHHVLQDLPFYEVARAIDAKVSQDQLD